MADAKKTDVQFKWEKTFSGWFTRFGSLAADGCEVSLWVDEKPFPEKFNTISWYFSGTVWLTQTNEETTIAPPSAAGWCETLQEAQEKAEYFGRLLLEATRILATSSKFSDPDDEGVTNAVTQRAPTL